jgi:hypothetical protein
MENQDRMTQIGRSFLSIVVPCYKRHPIAEKSS